MCDLLAYQECAKQQVQWGFWHWPIWCWLLNWTSCQLVVPDTFHTLLRPILDPVQHNLNVSDRPLKHVLMQGRKLSTCVEGHVHFIFIFMHWLTALLKRKNSRTSVIPLDTNLEILHSNKCYTFQSSWNQVDMPYPAAYPSKTGQKSFKQTLKSHPLEEMPLPPLKGLSGPCPAWLKYFTGYPQQVPKPCTWNKQPLLKSLARRLNDRQERQCWQEHIFGTLH